MPAARRAALSRWFSPTSYLALGVALGLAVVGFEMATASRLLVGG